MCVAECTIQHSAGSQKALERSSGIVALRPLGAKYVTVSSYVCHIGDSSRDEIGRCSHLALKLRLFREISIKTIETMSSGIAMASRRYNDHCAEP